jgi:hypothetical protein
MSIFSRWIVGLLLTCGCLPLTATELRNGQQAQVKTAFILNIARFVTWQEASLPETGEMILCFLGHNPFGNATDLIEGRSIGGRRLVIHSISTVNQVGHCQILYIPAERLPAYANLALDNTLTVTDLTVREQHDQYQGLCMIALVRDEKRLNFTINLQAANRAGLHISSELLKLGRIVED